LEYGAGDRPRRRGGPRSLGLSLPLTAIYDDTDLLRDGG